METLAAIGLLALMASMLGSGLAASSDDARMRRAVSACIEADRAARILAARHGPVHLLVRDEDLAVEIAAHGDEAAALRVISFPAGVVMKLLDSDGNPANEVFVDALSRSNDYTVLCTVGSRVSRLEIAGLTGWGVVATQDQAP